MENDLFHVTRARQKLGELRQQDILARVLEGRLQGTDLAWQKGMAEWQELEALFAEELAALRAEMPPPLPPVRPMVLPPPLAAQARRPSDLPPALPGYTGPMPPPLPPLPLRLSGSLLRPSAPSSAHRAPPPVCPAAVSSPSGAPSLPPQVPGGGRARLAALLKGLWGGLRGLARLVGRVFVRLGRVRPLAWSRPLQWAAVGAAALVVMGWLLGWMMFQGSASGLHAQARALAVQTGNGWKFEPGGVNLLQVAAAQGSAAAQADLAACLLRGEGCERDLPAAVDWFRQAAEAGNAAGQTGYGWCLVNGLGTAIDTARGLDMLEKAVAQGHVQARHDLGAVLLGNDSGDGEGDKRAVALIVQAAEEGCLDAQARAGYCHVIGRGMAKDVDKGLAMIRSAVAAGNAFGHFILGLCHRDGLGMPESASEALRYWQIAAGMHLAEAALFLAEAHERGTAGPVNLAEALRWYHLGAAAGMTQCITSIGRLYADGRGVPKNAVTAVEWYRRAADLADAEAERRLGQCYLSGQGVPQVTRMAVQWFQKAAEHGDGPACRELGILYEKGAHLPQDFKAAAQAYAMAHQLGDPDGSFGFACCLLDGRGLAEDVERGRALLEKLVTTDHAPSMVRLGFMEEEGWGRPRNGARARELYLKAAETGLPEGMLRLFEALGLGIGGDADSKESLRWLQLAMDKDYGPAWAARAWLAIQVSHTPEQDILRWVSRAVELGDPEGMRIMGHCQGFGIGMTADWPKARPWYEKAAAAGNGRAAFELGNTFIYGKAGSRDEKAALQWFQKAAALGHADAMAELGHVFNFGGLGQDENRAKAMEWLRRAAGRGSLDGKYNLGLLLMLEEDEAGEKWVAEAAEGGWPEACLTMSDMHARRAEIEEKEKNLAVAAAWMRRAAQGGLAEAQVLYARMLMSGTGVPHDAKEALVWLNKAIVKGDPAAVLLLAYCREKLPTIQVEDVEGMVKVLKERANAGNAEAQHLLGMNLHRGDLGLRKDFDQAAIWLKKAADQEHPEATLRLAQCYTNGTGVAVDATEADKWLYKAAMMGHPEAMELLAIDLKTTYSGGWSTWDWKTPALSWLLAAEAKKRVVDAKLKAEVLHRMTPEQIREAERIAAGILSPAVTEPSPATAWTSPRAAQEKSRPAARPATDPAPLTGQEKVLSNGSGFFVTQDGYIITNAHVVKGARRIVVIGAEWDGPAEVVASSSAHDLALLRVDLDGCSPLPVVSSAATRLGATVATIGFPVPALMGFSPKLSKGEISSLRGIQDDEARFQISAPVQPGNSGGPLVNERGELVGVIVAKLRGLKASESSEAYVPENVNYAVKSDVLLRFLQDHGPAGFTLPRSSSSGGGGSFEEVVQTVQKACVLIVVLDQ